MDKTEIVNRKYFFSSFRTEITEYNREGDNMTLKTTLLHVLRALRTMFRLSWPHAVCFAIVVQWLRLLMAIITTNHNLCTMLYVYTRNGHLIFEYSEFVRPGQALTPFCNLEEFNTRIIYLRNNPPERRALSGTGMWGSLLPYVMRYYKRY